MNWIRFVQYLHFHCTKLGGRTKIFISNTLLWWPSIFCIYWLASLTCCRQVKAETTEHLLFMPHLFMNCNGEPCNPCKVLHLDRKRHKPRFSHMLRTQCFLTWYQGFVPVSADSWVWMWHCSLQKQTYTDMVCYSKCVQHCIFLIKALVFVSIKHKMNSAFFIFN